MKRTLQRRDIHPTEAGVGTSEESIRCFLGEDFGAGEEPEQAASAPLGVRGGGTHGRNVVPKQGTSRRQPRRLRMARTSPITGEEPGNGEEWSRGTDRAVVAMMWEDNRTPTESRARGPLRPRNAGKGSVHCRRSRLNGAQHVAWVPDQAGEGEDKRCSGARDAGAALDLRRRLGRSSLTARRRALSRTGENPTSGILGRALETRLWRNWDPTPHTERAVMETLRLWCARQRSTRPHVRICEGESRMAELLDQEPEGPQQAFYLRAGGQARENGCPQFRHTNSAKPKRCPTKRMKCPRSTQISGCRIFRLPDSLRRNE